MRTNATIAVLALAVVLAGCAGTGLYSATEYNVTPVTGQTLQSLIENNGPPEVQGQVGDLTLVGWKGHESMSIWDRVLTALPIFAHGTKPSYVALVDPQGRVLSASRGRPGEFSSILWVFPAPVLAADTKP